MLSSGMKLATILLVSVALIISPPRAQATPLAVGPAIVILESILAGLTAKLADHLFDKITGRPDLRAIVAELQALRAEMARNRFPAGEKVFSDALEVIGPAITREEFKRLVLVPLQVHADELRKLENRVQRVETRDLDQERALKDHQRRLDRLEATSNVPSLSSFSETRAFSEGVPPAVDRELTTRSRVSEFGSSRAEYTPRPRIREVIETCRNGCCVYVTRVEEW